MQSLQKSSLVKTLLWLKSIYATQPKEVQPYIHQLADAIRQRLKDSGLITDVDNDPIVGKNTSLEAGMKALNLLPSDLTMEQQTTQALQAAGIDTTPLKYIMPSAMVTSGTSDTSKGTVVPTYGTSSTGAVTSTNAPKAPAGTVAMRDYLKNVYGLSDDAFKWDNNKGLTLNLNGASINLGKPTSPDQGQIINGTWYSDPSKLDTLMSLNGVQRQKNPIRDAIPQYLASKGINGATVDWDKTNNQVVLKIGDKTYNLGKPSDIGSLYNGTTYVSNQDIENALKPISSDLGLTTETGTTGTDYTTMTIPELNLAMEQNKADIMGKSYDQLISDIQSGENDMLNKIDATYKNLIDTSISSIEKALGEATSAIAATKGAYDEYAQQAYQEIDKNVNAAKTASKEDMAARGIYFSGLTTRALNSIEAQGISEKNKVNMEVIKYKASIDAQIAVLTANTKMSESQLTNELNASAALARLQLIEKDQDTIDAIKQEKLALDTQLQIDQVNLPMANELQRRQDEITNEQQAMDFFNKVYMPYLTLQYQDKWKTEDDDQKFLDYQLSLLSFYEQSQQFWSQLGFDKDKFNATFALDKAKFLSQYGSGSSTTPQATIPSWLKQYTPFITMRIDTLDALLAGQETNMNGTIYKLDPQDLPAVQAIRDFVHATMPGKEGELFTAWDEMEKAFGADAAKALIDQVDVGDNPNVQLVLFRQIIEDYQDPTDFAKFIKTNPTDKTKAYLNSLEKMLEGFGLNYNDANTAVTNFTTTLLYGYGG
jgi:hypothetical protein